MADGTTYLIDIAAKMDGGDASIEQLSQLAGKLEGMGGATKAFDAALAQTRSALEAAASASAAAASALGEGEQKYAQLERASTKAAQAVERYVAKGKSPPIELEIAAAKAADALTNEAEALDKLRASAAAADAEHKRLGSSLKNLEAGAKHAAKLDSAAAGTGKLNELAEGLGKFGPIGQLVGNKILGPIVGMQKMSGSAGAALGPVLGLAAGVVVLAAAAAAVAIAIGAAIVKTAVWAIGLADAARDAGILTEALTRSDERLAKLGDTLPEVQAATGLETKEIRDLAKQLSAAKVAADDMPVALKALGTLKALGLDSEAAKFVDELKQGKKSAGELATEVDRKFGDLLDKKMIGLDAQSKTLKRNLAETFGGLKIEGLLVELDRLVKLFDQTTASGKTIKFLFETLFQPLIDAVVASGPMVERFFLGMMIGALKIYIALKPAIKAVGELLGQDDASTIDWLKTAEVAGKAVTAAILTAAVAVGLLVAAAALVVAPFVLVGIVIGEAFAAGYNKIASVVEFIQSISLSELGTQMVQGLADGIQSAADKVRTALTGVVNDAIAAAKKLLGIASPSKVFEGLGKQVGAGFEGGIEGGSGGAQSALASMVEPPRVQAGAGAAASAGHTFQITINAPSGDARSIARELEGVLTRILEGDLTQLEPAPVTP